MLINYHLQKKKKKNQGFFFVLEIRSYLYSKYFELKAKFDLTILNDANKLKM